MESFTLEGNIKYAFSLRQKSSSKTMRLTKTLLWKSSTSIKFAKKDVEQH